MQSREGAKRQCRSDGDEGKVRRHLSEQLRHHAVYCVVSLDRSVRVMEFGRLAVELADRFGAASLVALVEDPLEVSLHHRFEVHLCLSGAMAKGRDGGGRHPGGSGRIRNRHNELLFLE